MIKKLVYTLIIFSLFACADDELSTTPSIEFISINPSAVVAHEDSIVIKIAYQDADGDIGENKEDVKNLFVEDNRNQVINEFRIQELSPPGSSIAIQGELDIVLNNASLVNGSSAEQVQYNIWLYDRAGNKSNTINTSSITVNP